MFRVIHPNRWFFWTIAALIVAGLLTMFYLQKTILELNQHSAGIESVGPQWVDPKYPGWHILRPEGFDLSIRYPSGWQVELDRFDANTFSLENSENFEENVTITVTDPKNEKLIRQSMRIESEEEVVIDRQKGTWLHGADTRDQATANVVLIRGDNRFYSITGSAAQFEKIVGSIRFINE